MPSLSKSQKRLFSMVKAAQKHPEVYKKMPQKIKDLADRMKKKDVNAFVNTDISELPDKVTKEELRRLIRGVILNEIANKSKSKLDQNQFQYIKDLSRKLTSQDLEEIEEHYSCGCSLCDKVYNRTIPNLKSDNGYLCPVISSRITDHITELLSKPLTYEHFI